MSYTATATLFYGTTFTLTELETVFNLVSGADNWFEIDRKLEEFGLERVVRDSFANDDNCNIISGKTLQVDANDGFSRIDWEALQVQTHVEMAYTKFESCFGPLLDLSKEFGWFLCAGNV